MATLELVERLRTYAGVSYQEASEALSACNDDILDAIVYLEKQGKVKKAPQEEPAHYSTQSQEPNQEQAYQSSRPKEESFGDVMTRFGHWLGSMLKKSTTNYFVVSKEGATTFSVPIIVLLLCLVLSVGLVLVLIIVGMFFGYSYRFSGEDFTPSDSVNNMMDAASRATSDVKESMKNTKDQHDKKE